MTRKGATGAPIRLAARQHGVVAVDQLRALGLTWDWVDARCRQGWLHRVHRGVYAVGRPALSMEGWWMAAVLACGPGAVLSHRSAGQLWGLVAGPETGHRGRHGRSRGAPGAVDVTVPSKSGRKPRTGLTIHRSITLRSDEVTERDAIPVTTPARTLLDLAAVLSRRKLERAVDEAERLGLCGPAELRAIAQRHRGRPGAGPLNALLRTHAIGSTVTRSELEERFLALCRSRRLPQPAVNVPLHGYIVDFLWPPARLIAEVDGRATHGTSRAFQRDRDRDTRLTAHGYRTLRFTWWDVTRRPAVVGDRVRRTLRAA
jgi:very-short-patch-repair endonuclease